MAFHVYLNVVLLLLCCNNMPIILCLTTLCCWYIEPYLWFVYFLISLSANQTASLQTTWECSLWSLGRCIRAGSNKSKYTMVQIGAWSRSHHKRTAQEFIWKWTKTTSSKGSRCSSLSLALCLCVRVFIYLFKEESQNSSTETEVIPFRS